MFSNYLTISIPYDLLHIDIFIFNEWTNEWVSEMITNDFHLSLCIFSNKLTLAIIILQNISILNCKRSSLTLELLENSICVLSGSYFNIHILLDTMRNQINLLTVDFNFICYTLQTFTILKNSCVATHIAAWFYKLHFIKRIPFTLWHLSINQMIIIIIIQMIHFTFCEIPCM